jgi:hypothetical protein
MDGVLLAAGSLWPVHRISPCQKSTHGVRFARPSDGRRHVFDACSSLKLVPTQRKLTCIKAWQIRIIIVAPEAHFHEPFFASLDLDVRNIFAESHPEHRWECSNHLASHLQNRALSLSLSLSLYIYIYIGLLLATLGDKKSSSLLKPHFHFMFAG